MIINENSFRLLITCPKLFSFDRITDTKPEEDIKIKLLNLIHSKITLYFLKNDKIDNSIIYQIILNVFLKEVPKDILTAEKTILLNRIILYINDSIQLFNIENYIPVFGPFLLNKSISNSILKLKINGIYRSLKKQTLHLVLFSPYNTRHSILNDPTIKYKMQELATLVPEHYTKRTRIFTHVFYIKGDTLLKEIISSEEITKTNFTPLIQLAENNIYYPIIPCLRKCKYKKICK